ncbi:unnamed protein product [Candida verbasci]|uniref:Uncharacterized protein n=1 Tax=Candida verbasci TaxID=1227364 RepID=A0A9W4XK54_9ASCO|nr:unnamed protein product [Candida verbasci]
MVINPYINKIYENEEDLNSMVHNLGLIYEKPISESKIKLLKSKTRKIKKIRSSSSLNNSRSSSSSENHNKIFNNLSLNLNGSGKNRVSSSPQQSKNYYDNSPTSDHFPNVSTSYKKMRSRSGGEYDLDSTLIQQYIRQQKEQMHQQQVPQVSMDYYNTNQHYSHLPPHQYTHQQQFQQYPQDNFKVSQNSMKNLQQEYYSGNGNGNVNDLPPAPTPSMINKFG